MKRHFQYFILLALSGLAFSFTSDSAKILDAQDIEYLNWKDRKLTWDDFQGNVPAETDFDALTHSEIDFRFEGEGVILKFTINTLFDPTQSWKKDGVTKEVLKHEQGHFDITEYHSRLLRKNLKTNRYKGFDTIEQEIRDMFNEASTAANEMQLLYDKQTNHSINQKKQNKWNKKIRKMLSSTSTYKNPRLNVKVGYLSE